MWRVFIKGDGLTRFLPLIFFAMFSSQALLEGFSNLASNSRNRPRFFINTSLKCRNSCLPLDTGRRYSLHCLLRRATTPRNNSGESFYNNFEGFPPSLKMTSKQKIDYACRALLTRNILRVKNIGLFLYVTLTYRKLIQLTNHKHFTLSNESQRNLKN
jgi:hypothetical protein